MNAKLVLIGAIVTLATVIAAAVAVMNQPRLTAAEVSGEPAFAQLRQSPDTVARIVVADKDGEFAVARNGAGLWVAPDTHGYPVASDKVRELVATMAGMDLIEAKTAKPERFARLEVEDIDGDDADSRRVRLEAADGAVLADTIVGKRRYGFTGGRETGTYIRRDGDERAWLASGGLVVNTKPADWLDKGIVDIAADSVQAVTIEPAVGDSYMAARDQADADLTLTTVPDGHAAKAAEVKRMASILTSIEFDDVRPAADVAMPETADTARVRTFDGLEVTVSTAEVDGDHWAVVAAAAMVEAADATDETNAVREIARAINDRVDGWAYRIPAHVAARLIKPRDTLLEDEAPQSQLDPSSTPAPGTVPPTDDNEAAPEFGVQ